jgi:hypothetical protein
MEKDQHTVDKLRLKHKVLQCVNAVLMCAPKPFPFLVTVHPFSFRERAPFSILKPWGAQVELTLLCPEFASGPSLASALNLC